ncbi:MAG: hypothetical protein QXS75_04240 [Thermoplasmatales archaeon]
MRKRVRDQETEKAAKRRKITSTSSSTYGTVTRTRGFYAIKGETKYFDSNRHALVIGSQLWNDTNGCIYNPVIPGSSPAVIGTFCCPKQGTGYNERIGKEIHVHKIRIQGMIEVRHQKDVNLGAILSREIRMMLVQDTQTNGTQFTGNELMSVESNAPLYTFQNINNFGRFRVLKDKFMVIQNPNISVNADSGTPALCANEQLRQFKWSIRFRKPIRVRFNAANGGGIADIVDNSFSLVVNTVPLATAPQPEMWIAYQSRVVYTDA